MMALYEQQQASRERWRQAAKRFGGHQEHKESAAADRGAGGVIQMIDDLREDLIKKMAELSTEKKRHRLSMRGTFRTALRSVPLIRRCW